MSIHPTPCPADDPAGRPGPRGRRRTRRPTRPSATPAEDAHHPTSATGPGAPLPRDLASELPDDLQDLRSAWADQAPFPPQAALQQLADVLESRVGMFRGMKSSLAPWAEFADLFQQLFYNLARLGSFATAVTAGRVNDAFLAVCFRNVCLQAWRKEMSRRRHDLATIEEQPAASPGAFDDMAQREDVQRVLASLTAPERELLELVADPDVDYQQIAERLGVTPGTARNKVCALRKRLRHRFPELAGSGR